MRALAMFSYFSYPSPGQVNIQTCVTCVCVWRNQLKEMTMPIYQDKKKYFIVI